MKDDLRPLVRSFLLLLCLSGFFMVFISESKKIPEQKNQYALLITTTTLKREYYKVKPNDSVEKIARKFILRPDQLMKTNGLSRSSVLEVGQILHIPQIKWEPQEGIASWYGKRFHGGRMADGRKFDMYNPNIIAQDNDIKYPLGMLVRVINLENGKYIEAVVSDRGNFYKKYGRIADLSRAAAQKIGVGVSRVRLEPLPKKITVKLSVIPQTD